MAKEYLYKGRTPVVIGPEILVNGIVDCITQDARIVHLSDLPEHPKSLQMYTNKPIENEYRKVFARESELCKNYLVSLLQNTTKVDFPENYNDRLKKLIPEEIVDARLWKYFVVANQTAMTRNICYLISNDRDRLIFKDELEMLSIFAFSSQEFIDLITIKTPPYASS